jgi:hypothetical protein
MPSLQDENVHLRETVAALVRTLRRVEDHFGGQYVHIKSDDPDFLILEVVRESIRQAEEALTSKS